MGNCLSSTRRVTSVIDRPPTKHDGGGDEDETTETSTKTDSFGIVPTKLTPVPSQPHGISTVPSFFNPDAKPTIFEYQFIKHIGHGAQSDVFLVQNTENEIFYAAKVYDRTYLFRTSIGDAEQPIHKLIREAQIMSTIQHPNCLNLVELLEDEYTNSIILILPFADDGALSSYSYKADPLPENDAKFYFFQIALGLQYVHSQNIIHRDLKPDNILKFKDGHVVIADFSVSIMLGNESDLLDDTDGTPAFYSPEECRGDPYLGKPTDVWAFGMMLYVMMFGKLPFFDADDEGVFFSQFFKISQRIVSDEFAYPESIPISAELRDFFSHVLDKDATTRYTIDQVVEHPWFAGCMEAYYAKFAVGGEEEEEIEEGQIRMPNDD
ncbi:CAMK family protein kinase [Tritrichomonas foetus]|uniref:CAMK family protein kinase n=1 Tax=Tritrichomonas foetus TaxID=1144522 RepID=A0A1J4KLE3_9EUKA|nr:CAMK family protein kinase [Tritrichomonas foetus]|eukprot:OHT10197.1 CAMK family protein kinase [Tritrichomonas foetus]